MYRFLRERESTHTLFPKHYSLSVVIFSTVADKVSFSRRRTPAFSHVTEATFSHSSLIKLAWHPLLDVEILVVHNVLVAIRHQNTTAAYDWIARIPWRHQGSVQVHFHFTSRTGCWYCHLDLEPLCSLGGTGRASTRLSSVKFGLAFEYVTCLKTSADRMRPGNQKKQRKTSEKRSSRDRQ